VFLGVDIGTSGVKAVLTDDDGAVAASASAPLTVSRPRLLWSEQDPEQWWTATKIAVSALPAAARSKVQAIGLSGQMHGAVLLDAADRVLRPAILWNDGRAGRECAELEAASRAVGRSPATSPCPASRRPSCGGCGDMSRRCSPPSRACCFPKTTCAFA
jgi:xylulokinase